VNAFSYHKVLDRGFALVRDAAGQPIRSATAVAAGDQIDIELADGHLPAVATGGAPKKKRGGGPGGGQGSLFG
jgi:exodeoxyribonuclease VII large subunit